MAEIKFKYKSFSDFMNEKSANTDISHSSSVQENQKIYDLTGCKDDVILERFHQYIDAEYESSESNEERFYAGITCNVEENLRRHNIQSYIFCAKVDSYEVASRIEQLLHDKYGVYIGKLGGDSAGRGGNDGSDGEPESNIVYLAQRDKANFKE